jgi:hypothetical protein
MVGTVSQDSQESFVRQMRLQRSVLEAMISGFAVVDHALN